MAQTLFNLLERFHEDEQGAEGLEKLLILAAVVLPLLGVLLYFRDQINDWVSGKWTDVKSESNNFTPGS